MRCSTNKCFIAVYLKDVLFDEIAFTAILRCSAGRFAFHTLEVTVSVFVFVDGFVKGFDGKLDAVVFFGRDIDKLFKNIAVIQIPGLFKTFAFNNVNGSHGRGNGSRTAQHLVSDIRNSMTVDFEKDFHGVPAGSQHFRYLIGIGQTSHVRLFQIIFNGLFRIPAIYQHFLLIFGIGLKNRFDLVILNIFGWVHGTAPKG
jgi:hypothetical protein